MGQSKNRITPLLSLCPEPLETHDEEIFRPTYRYNRRSHNLRRPRYLVPSEPHLPLPRRAVFYWELNTQSPWLAMPRRSLYINHNIDIP